MITEVCICVCLWVVMKRFYEFQSVRMCTCMHILYVRAHIRTYVFVVQVDNFGCVLYLCAHL